MQAFLVLCDAANADAATGKLNLLGAGWSLTGPAVPMSAVAGFIRLPWDEAHGEDLSFLLQIVDNSGEPVRPFTDNNEPFRIGGKFTLPDPEQAEEAAKTVPLNISFAFPLPPLPLMPGCTYRWILEAQDKEVASVAFTVRTDPSAG
ncbi:DUF6941 family protein [Nonomuraea coxensis]|uniref:DUF6941 family protein n=1 Tax=Nonomuraea coxensis TaxID=404386 RepID=UPI0003652F20|nr:hypothetical protein [Nonomuraea coxensis]